MKSCCMGTCCAFLLGSWISLASAATIATFADPSLNNVIPMFDIDLNAAKVTGGWSDDQTGLILEIPALGDIHSDAFFIMTELDYFGTISGGTTGAGAISFYADNQLTTTTPLLNITFDVAHVTVHGLGATNIFSLTSDNVQFTGSVIDALSPSGLPLLLSDQSFAFSFTNQTAYGDMIPPDPDGYTSTASFTSSADYSVIPEPITLTLLALGGFALKRRC